MKEALKVIDSYSSELYIEELEDGSYVLTYVRKATGEEADIYITREASRELVRYMI